MTFKRRVLKNWSKIQLLINLNNILIKVTDRDQLILPLINSIVKLKMKKKLLERFTLLISFRFIILNENKQLHQLNYTGNCKKLPYGRLF